MPFFMNFTVLLWALIPFCQFCVTFTWRILNKGCSHRAQCPFWWYRYVDNTYCKLNKCYSLEFTDHLISLDSDIKCSTEGEENKTLSIKVQIYLKSTHTDEYLNFDSNHSVDHNLELIVLYTTGRTLLSPTILIDIQNIIYTKSALS